MLFLVEILLQSLSVEHRQQWYDDYGHDTGYGDGEAAHGAGDFAFGHGGRGADGVAGGAGGQSPGDVGFNVQQFPQGGGEDGAKDTGADHCDDGAAYDAAHFPGNAGGDWGGYGFWGQAGVDFQWEVEGFGHNQDAAHGGQAAHEDAHQDGQCVLFQHLDLAVQGYGKAYGSRGQEPVDDICSGGVVAVVWNVQQHQNTDDGGYGEQNRVEQNEFDPVCQLFVHEVKTDGQKRAEVGVAGQEGNEIIHGGPPFQSRNRTCRMMHQPDCCVR